MNETNSLEHIRQRIGITRPEMTRLVGARNGRDGLFICENRQLDPIFLRRAYELEQLYDNWKAQVLEEVDKRERITIREFTKIFATITPHKDHNYAPSAPEMHVNTLRERGFIKVPITPQGIHDLFEVHESYLANSQGNGIGRSARRRAPLGQAFLFWLEHRKWGFVKSASPDHVRQPRRKTAKESTQEATDEPIAVAP